MSDKDNIKDLFQKELGNYKAKVNPSVWNGVQSAIGSAGVAVGTSIGVAAKIGIGIGVAAAITVATILVTNSSEENKKPKEQIEHKIAKKSPNSQPEKSTGLSTSENSETTTEKTTETVNSAKNIGENKTVENTKNEEQNVESSPSTDESLSSSEANPVPSKSNNSSLENTIPKEAPTNKNTPNSSAKNNSTPPNKVPNKEQLVPLEFEPVIVQQKNQFVTFKVNNLPKEANVIWNFGDGNYERNRNPEHFYEKSGAYTIQVTVEKGSQQKSKTLKLTIEVKGKLINLPTVFTPNGDGQNDVFFIESEHIKEFQITIMDIKQNTVFTSNDTDFKWDGLNRAGSPAPEGNYMYIIVAKDDAGNVINEYKQLRLQRQH